MVDKISNNKPSANKVIKSFVYAFNGIKHGFITQLNIKVHIIISILVIVAGFLLNISLNQWILIIIVMAMVFSAELINTAIEGVVDIISPDYDKKAGLIKDCAAAAVLITAIAAAIVGMLIFAPKLIELFK